MAGPLLRHWRRGFNGRGDARVGHGRSGRLDDRSPDTVQVDPDGRRNLVARIGDAAGYQRLAATPAIQADVCRSSKL